MLEELLLWDGALEEAKLLLEVPFTFGDCRGVAAIAADWLRAAFENMLRLDDAGRDESKTFCFLVALV